MKETTPSQSPPLKRGRGKTTDTIEGIWAKLYNWRMKSIGVKRVYQKTLESISLRDGEKLLDVGCGTGVFLRMLSERYPQAKLSGIDASKDMIAEACKEVGLPAQAGKSITCSYADASILPFEDAYFDVVVSLLAFHHMPPTIKSGAVREIARVLKGGGKLLIVDFGNSNSLFGALRTFFLGFHSYTKGNMTLIEQELEKNGLAIARKDFQWGLIEHLEASKLIKLA